MRPLLISAFALALAAPASSAQSGCLPNDQKGQMLLSYMRTYSVSPTGGNNTVRIALGLPSISDSTTVKLVTQETTCKKARDAYAANVPSNAAVPPTGRVYVVAIGDKFAVLDPVFRYTTIDRYTIQILDSRYKLIKFFG